MSLGQDSLKTENISRNCSKVRAPSGDSPNTSHTRRRNGFSCVRDGRDREGREGRKVRKGFRKKERNEGKKERRKKIRKDEKDRKH